MYTMCVILVQCFERFTNYPYYYYYDDDDDDDDDDYMAARAPHITPVNHHRSRNHSCSTRAIQLKSLFTKNVGTQHLTFNKRSRINEDRLTITYFFCLFFLFI